MYIIPVYLNSELAVQLNIYIKSYSKRSNVCCVASNH